MPTRSVNLKLVVPRGRHDDGRLNAIWTTHKAINAATRYYEEQLLAMRQHPYVTEAGDIDDATTEDRATDLVAKAWQRTGRPQGDPTEALQLLRKLYETMVPSAIGEEGNAQAANAFASPLMDPKSKGLQSVFETLENVPNWMEGVRKGEVEAFDAAQLWLQSKGGQDRLRPTNRPPKWVRLARENDPSWLTAFVKYIDEKRAKDLGVATLIKRLREVGLLPLFEPYFASRLAERQGAVSPWDRLCLRLAVAHLLSWESWCLKSAAEHASRVERLNNLRDRILTTQLDEKIEALQRYESDRTEELKGRDPLGREPRPRIKESMVRGWDRSQVRGMRHIDPKTDDWREVHLAHVESLGNRLWLRCNACGHSMTPAPREFAHQHHLDMKTPLLSIARRLKCTHCNERKAHCWPEPYGIELKGP